MDIKLKMDELVNKIKDAVAEAEAFADENDIGFQLSVAYGMGGWYESGFWMSSTESCY